MTRLSRTAALLAAALLLAGCHPAAPRGAAGSAGGSQPQLRLVAFDSCADLLQGLRAAARASVGPYGLGGPGPIMAKNAAGGPAVPVPEAAAPGAAARADAAPAGAA